MRRPAQHRLSRAAGAAQGAEVSAARDSDHPPALSQHAFSDWRRRPAARRLPDLCGPGWLARCRLLWARARAEQLPSLYADGGRLLRAEYRRREPGHRAAGGDGLRPPGGRVGYSRLPLGDSQSARWPARAPKNHEQLAWAVCHLLDDEATRRRYAEAGPTCGRSLAGRTSPRRSRRIIGSSARSITHACA